MAIKTVTGKLTGPNNVAIGGALVTAQLSASAVIAATQEIAPLAITTSTATDGTWSLSLEANGDLTPASTYYTVSVGPNWTATAIVPQTAGPFLIENIMAVAPAAWLGGTAATLNPAGDLAVRSLTVLPSGPYTPSAAAGNMSLPAAGVLTLGGTAGGAGNLTIPGQLMAAMPTTFNSGTTLAGSTNSAPKVSGDQRAYVGYYFVAIAQGGSSVPIISASFDGTNTTLTISTIPSLGAGQSYEISLWPGGTAGRARSSPEPDPNVAIVYKPSAASTALQIGTDSMLYQRDGATVYLIRLAGTGAGGNHFNDLRISDLGCDVIETQGEYSAAGSPNGTEPAGIEGYLGYNGQNFKLFRDNINSPRSKAVEMLGSTGQTTLFAAAATSGAQFNDSPKHRLIGTSWTGAASLDSIAYILNHVIDATGAKELQLGFEAGGAGTGKIRPLVLLQADGGISLGNSADPGVAGVWWDGTETFLQATSGPIFLRPVAGNNNNALVGSAGSWLTKDGSGTTRNTLDDGAGNMAFKAQLLRSRQTPTQAVLGTGVDARLGELVAPAALTSAQLVGAPLNAATGQRLTFTILQDGTGGRAVTWNAVFKVSWSDTGNTLNKRSTIEFEFDGTNWNQCGAQVPYV